MQGKNLRSRRPLAGWMRSCSIFAENYSIQHGGTVHVTDYNESCSIKFTLCSGDGNAGSKLDRMFSLVEFSSAYRTG
jgi:hypothetical protein